MKSKTYNLISNEISREILFEAKGIPVKISFFWDSHGKLIPFTGGPKETKTMSKKSADVIITKVIREIRVSENDNEPIEFESWNITLNGEEVSADVYRYNWTGINLNVKAVVGSG